jgi:hypothetical protein
MTFDESFREDTLYHDTLKKIPYSVETRFDVKITLRWILVKQGLRVWTEPVMVRTVPNGGLL